MSILLGLLRNLLLVAFLGTCYVVCAFAILALFAAMYNGLLSDRSANDFGASTQKKRLSFRLDRELTKRRKRKIIVR